MRAIPFSRRALIGAALASIPPAAWAQSAGRSLRDAAGRESRIPARITRVFPAGPPASQLIWSVAPDLLAGWTRRPSSAELAFLPPEAAGLPEIGRLTGRGDTANAEAVLALKPDLILDYGSTGPTYASLADRLQAQTGLPTLLLDGSLTRIPETYRLLGDILDRAPAAKERADIAARLLAEAEDCAARLTARGRPRVYYGRGPRGLETGLTGSINTEIIEAVGAENVSARSLGSGGLAQVSPEDVLAWDPDWIITPDPAFAAATKTDPVWSSLRAVKAGRVVLAPVLPNGWVDFPPAANRLLGLAWLPVLFGDQPADGLAARIADLYTLLFHRRPERAQLEALLQGALPRSI